MFSCQLAVFSCQFAVFSFQFSVFSCQLSVFSFQLSVISCHPEWSPKDATKDLRYQRSSADPDPAFGGIRMTIIL